MSDLRILYVDTETVWRGGQEQLFTLMRGMKERGHRVHLASAPNSPLASRARQLDIPIYAFRQRSELSPLAFWRMWRILSALHVDIIHFNTPRSILCGGVSAKLCAVPVRICSRRVNFPLRSPLSRFKYNWMHEQVVTVSHSIRKTLLEGGVYPELVTVIYEGVDLNWIDRQTPPPLPSPGNGPVVGTVAYLSPEKGHLVLLEAARSLVSERSEVRFLIVGSGELMEDLKNTVKGWALQDQVIFTGFRPDSEALMKQFDVFCLPSVSEGLSSAILVAMANRLPVVATRVGGIPELVVEGETGLLVPPNDPEQLAAALSKILSTPTLRQTMGQAGRHRVEEHFTLDRKLNETERLYRRLVGERSMG